MRPAGSLPPVIFQYRCVFCRQNRLRSTHRADGIEFQRALGGGYHLGGVSAL
jgi:hypothetical protein